MSVYFRELTTFKEFHTTLHLQEQVLGLSDIEKFGAILLNLLARKNPPLGFVAAAFDDSVSTETPIGTAVLMATGLLNTYYFAYMALQQDYQGKKNGFLFFQYVRDAMMQRGIESILYLYDNLNYRLANLYHSKLNVKGIEYKEDVYELSEDERKTIPKDSFLIEWRLNDPQTEAKIKGEFVKTPIDDVIKSVKKATLDNMPLVNKILVEIPNNFTELKTTNPKAALQWRLQTRELFDFYMNKNGYTATEFYRTQDGEKNFYLLEKLE